MNGEGVGLLFHLPAAAAANREAREAFEASGVDVAEGLKDPGAAFGQIVFRINGARAEGVKDGAGPGD